MEGLSVIVAELFGVGATREPRAQATGISLTNLFLSLFTKFSTTTKWSIYGIVNLKFVGDDSRCKKNGRCVVTVLTRRRCQKCRYNRCQMAGMTPDAVLNEDQKRIRFRKVNQKRQMLASQRGRHSSARLSERIVLEDIDDADDDFDDDGGDDDGAVVNDDVEVNVVENDDEEELPRTIEDGEIHPVPEAREEVLAPSHREMEMIQNHSEEDEEMISISYNESETVQECFIEKEQKVQSFIHNSSDKVMTGIRSVVQSYQVCCTSF